MYGDSLLTPVAPDCQQRCVPVMNKEVYACDNYQQTNACEVRVVNTSLNGGNPVKVDILVTFEWLLVYELLIDMNTIKEMAVLLIIPQVQ